MLRVRSTVRNFREFEIWQQGIKIVKAVYQLSDYLPEREKYGLRNQICRSAVSIPSNIAEGCARGGEKDFKRFLEIAKGSAFELETQLIIIQHLELVEPSRIELILGALNSEQRRDQHSYQQNKGYRQPPIANSQQHSSNEPPP